MKILIIGQAPPAVKQEYPYDTTLLYEMLSWVGVGKKEAQDMFDFEALTDKFPGHGKNGHLIPTTADIQRHFKNVLHGKVEGARKIIILGAVASKTFDHYPFRPGTKVIHLIHPSRRNYAKIMKTKGEIFDQLSFILNEL